MPGRGLAAIISHSKAKENSKKLFLFSNQDLSNLMVDLEDEFKKTRKKDILIFSGAVAATGLTALGSYIFEYNVEIPTYIGLGGFLISMIHHGIVIKEAMYNRFFYKFAKKEYDSRNFEI